MRVCQLVNLYLTHRHREQAPSHSGYSVYQRSRTTLKPIQSRGVRHLEQLQQQPIPGIA